jgi:hypothetical protein
VHDIVGKVPDPFNLHCLYLLDTADPALPRIFRRRRRWLPLYYPMFNNACNFAYEVLSDRKIKVHLVSSGIGDDFPYENFPDELPRRRIRLAPLSYDEQKTLVYGITTRNLLSEGALSNADRRFLARIHYPFTQIGGFQNMMQGVPEQPCANVDCENAKWSIGLSIFAVVWNQPIRNFLLWGELMDYSQLIFQVCGKCSTIHVCNRCD